MIKAIDAHHHFWDPSKGDYSWMTKDHNPINRIFEPDDLAPLLQSVDVDGTVLVQTWSSMEESFDFLSIAAETDFVKGVVGWVDMTKTGFGDELDRLLSSEHGAYLKGIRHQVHDEKDSEWLLRSDVIGSLAEIEKRDLVYDLLIRPREISASLEIAQRFPTLRFVVDHIAKPEIANDGYDSWSKLMEGFAQYKDHVWCKLSGMVTEAEWDTWNASEIRPYIERVIDIFGTDRVMLGSDWPVCTLAADYQSTISLVRVAIQELSEDDQHKILRTNAIDAYKLAVSK